MRLLHGRTGESVPSSDDPGDTAGSSGSAGDG